MCLYVTSQNLNSIPFVKGKITAFKVLRKGLKLIALYRAYGYNPGYNEAKEDILPLIRYQISPYSIKEEPVIEGGAIHVCLSRGSALKHTAGVSDSVVVPVTCYKKDFIARGKHGEACFKKIFISKENYEKALKAKNKFELVKGK